MIQESLSSQLLTTLKTAIEDKFTSVGIAGSMGEYSNREPLLNGYYGTINVDYSPAVSFNTDFYSKIFTITIEVRVKWDEGFNSLRSLYDLRDFLVEYIYGEVRKDGLTIGLGNYLKGLTHKKQQTFWDVNQQGNSIGQSVIVFEWILSI